MEQIGRYKILRELGRGAMGVVYGATDPLIGRTVAIKTIRLSNLDLSDNREELTKRLYREAQSAGILSHPGIITIHDVGEQGEDAYIVMEFVDGKSLEGLIASGTSQSTDTLLLALRKAAVALDYAHSKGIIHRDIKPSNIMICHDGTVKIADFGVAKLATSTSMTQSGLVLGTPSYMSPEQARGLTIDGRSDQFSLAVVAYRILTGKLPFEAPTLTALLTKILWEEPDYENAGLLPPLLNVFKKALAKDPQLRFGTCEEFMQQLDAAYAQPKTQWPNNVPESVLAPEISRPHAEIPHFTETAGRAQKSVLEQSSLIPPAAPSPSSSEEKSRSQALPSPQPEAPAETPKGKKPMLIAWVSLGVVALAVIAFFGVKLLQKPASSVQTSAPNTPSVQENPTPAAAVTPPEQIQDSTPVTPTSSPAQPVTPPAKPEVKTAKPQVKAESRPVPRQSDSIKIIPPETAAAGSPKPAKPSAKSFYPEAGTLVWSGDLRKNAVLVIEDKEASIGSISGKLPGKPIEIEVEPKEVIIRQKPSAENGWKLIILYSGSQRYSDIEIRWRTIK